MKTLKRTLALVLVLALSASVLAIGGFAAGVTYPDNFKGYTDADAAKASEQAKAIDVVMGLGIIKGVSDTEIDVDGTLTRAQAAKIVCYAALGEDVAEALAAGDTGFSDVAPNMWANKYISYCVYMGWINGNGDGTFDPDGELTGYAFAKMLLNALGYGLKEDKDGNIVNTYTGTYWATAVSQQANALKLFAGLKGVNFNGKISRAQAMQIVFNALQAETASDANVLAYNIQEIKDDELVDDYGRNFTYFKLGDKAISGTYVKEADYVYVALAGGDVEEDIAKAYAKEAGLKATDVIIDNIAWEEICVGEVYEFAVSTTDKKNDTLTLISYWYYYFDEVEKISDTSAKDVDYKKDIDLVYDNIVHEDELTLSLAKGDVIAIPYSYTTEKSIYADAVKLDAKEGKITAFGKDYTLTVGGEKLPVDENRWDADKIISDRDDFKSVMSYYVSPFGTLARIELKGEAAAKYDKIVGYALKGQSKAYAGSSDADLLGDGGKEAVEGQAVIQILGTDGVTAVYDIAVKNDAKAKKASFTGTDAINYSDIGFNVADGAIETKSAFDVKKIVEYYVDSNGDIVIVKAEAPATVVTKKADLKVGSGKANSNTVISIVSVKDGKVSGTSEIKGYKNFVDAKYETAYVVTDSKTDFITNIYAFNVAAESAKPLDTIAYCKTIGDLTADGTEVTFIIDGKAVDYKYDAKKVTTLTEKKYFTLTVEDGAVTAATAKTPTKSDLTVALVDDAFVQFADGEILEFAKNTNTYDLTNKSLELAKDVKVDYFQLDTDNLVIFIVGEVK